MSIDAHGFAFYRICMASDPTKLEQLASELDPKDRARLALRLIESLDPGTDEDAEALWLEEAERRLARYDAGESESLPANDVISDITNKLG